MVDCMTDNPDPHPTRKSATPSRAGVDAVGTSGSVAFQFSRKARRSCSRAAARSGAGGEDPGAALEAGADDVINHRRVPGAVVAPESFVAVKAALEAQEPRAGAGHITRRPGNTSAVSGEQAAALQKLIDMLEDLDDVQKVYSNAEFA